MSNLKVSTYLERNVRLIKDLIQNSPWWDPPFLWKIQAAYLDHIQIQFQASFNRKDHALGKKGLEPYFGQQLGMYY